MRRPVEELRKPSEDFWSNYEEFTENRIMRPGLIVGQNQEDSRRTKCRYQKRKKKTNSSWMFSTINYLHLNFTWSNKVLKINSRICLYIYVHIFIISSINMFAFQYTTLYPPPTTALCYHREKLFNPVNPSNTACLPAFIPLPGKETLQQILPFLIKSLSGGKTSSGDSCFHSFAV